MGALLLAGLDAAADRGERLAAAEKCLAAFVRQHPEHPSAMAARVQLGRVTMSLGVSRPNGPWIRSGLPRVNSGPQEARSRYADALAVFAVAEPQCDELQKRLAEARRSRARRGSGPA